MALVPRTLRPSVMIRRKAMYSGFLGNSGFWKVVGVVVFGKSTITKMFGRTTEVIDVSSLGAERFMTITTAKPITRRRRRRLARRGVEVPTLKQQKALGKLWAADASARKLAARR